MFVAAVSMDNPEIVDIYDKLFLRRQLIQYFIIILQNNMNRKFSSHRVK